MKSMKRSHTKTEDGLTERSMSKEFAPGDSFLLFDEHMENYNVETSALHRKLKSKTDALRILRKEIDEFRTERDQFKLMAETLQLRYSADKRHHSDLANLDKPNAAAIMHETRERNIKLITQVETLKQKLNEMQGDMDALRGTTGLIPPKVSKSCDTTIEHISKEEMMWKGERVKFIVHLEDLKKKNAQLAFDFKALIDEKEEIVTERDAYKCKAHRLNHELLAALKANETHPKFLDIDSLILENKYLQERLKNSESELQFTKQTADKFKAMLETKRKKGIIKLGTSSNEDNILSHKQVKNMLESGIDLPTKTETIQDLKSLCLALLDNLNDKNIALSHQKKTNKILASKIAELEQRIQTLTNLEPTSSDASEYSASQLLLRGYCPAQVDTSSNLDTEKYAASTTKIKCEATDDSGTMSSEGSRKASPHVCPSDDGMSSLSTESGRSVLSSEYGNDFNATACNLNDFMHAAMFAYKTPSTTTDSGNYAFQGEQTNPLVPSYIAKQRMEDLRDLPPELAAMVQKALHELDLRDFDEVVGSCEGVSVEAEEYLNSQRIAIEEEIYDEKEEEDEVQEQEDDATIMREFKRCG